MPVLAVLGFYKENVNFLHFYFSKNAITRN